MTSTITGRTPASTAAECARKRRRTRALAVLAAAGATFTVWAIAHPLAGADLVVDTGSGPHHRDTGRGRSRDGCRRAGGLGPAGPARTLHPPAAAVWTWIAGAVLLISLLGPIGSAVGAGATAALVAMHLATGAVLIPLMARSSVQNCPG